MLCKNGLHEIPPDAPRIGRKGHAHHCIECYKAKRRRGSKRKRLNGKGAVYDKTYNDKRGPRLDQYENSPRKRAHDLMKKYGMTLGQAEKMGVIPPDVQEALHGDHPA